MAAVAAFLATAWNMSDLGRASRSLAAQRAAAKREGVPMEWGDLRRLAPPVDVADNAAVPYARAFATLQKASVFKGLKPDDLQKEIAAGKAKPEDLAKLRVALAAAAPALREVEEGSRRKGFSFDRQWEKGFSLVFPEYANARTAIRALVLRAMTATDPAAAGRDLGAAARLRAHLGSEPTYIGTLVAVSMENDVHAGVRFLGRRGGAWAKAVEPALADLGPLPDLRRVLAGEAVSGMHLGEELARLGPQAFGFAGGDGEETSSGPPALRLARFGPVRSAFEARVVEYWRGVYAKLPQDPLDWRALKAATQVPATQSGLSYTLLDLSLPVLTSLGDLPPQFEAQRRLSRAALDLWQGRAPALPADPFGTGPLGLRRDAKGWTLWSVGPDGIDDGGKKRAKASDVRYDLVVEGVRI